MRWIRGLGMAALVLGVGCNDVDEFDERVLGPDGLITTGRADFTRYVALGDSYAAGVVNGAFTCSGQIFSYPNLIARQVGLQVADSCTPAPEQLPADVTVFQQPLVTDPGVGSPLVLSNPGPPPVILPVAATGIPTNGDLPRPYNNLGIPGADVREINAARNQATSFDANSAFNIVLRGIDTAPQQARILDATFVTFWLGGNDVLTSLLSGGEVPPSDVSVFATEYDRALSVLLASAPSGIVVANLADITLLPFATAIPPIVVNPTTQQPVLVGPPPGQTVPLIGPEGPLTLGEDFVTLLAAPLLAQGIGVPTAVGGSGQPLPDSVVITESEAEVIRDAIDSYNNAIENAADNRNAVVVDIASFAAQVLANNGIVAANGQQLSTRFLGAGGPAGSAPFFGLDGIHPTPKGQGHFANLFIQTINAAFAASIPLVDVSSLPTFIGPTPPAADVFSDLLAARAGGSGLAGRQPVVSVRWPAGLDTSLW